MKAFLFITALLVVSAFAEEAAKSDKKHAKRGLSLGYGGYSGGYSGLGYSSLGHGAQGYSSLGYSGLGHSSLGYSGLGYSAGYVAAAPLAAHTVGVTKAAHTHTHSVETKVVAQPYAVPQPYPVVQTRTQVVDRPVPQPYAVHVPQPYPVEVVKHV
ncbi:lamprin 1.8-10-like, partial [Sitodiplosis mosellana]|uniref:lamprin 1.8-10-like n=1 Tax=Sitodiplosis mosellana TaxID=263140 RepID=UPI002443C707